MSRRGILGAAIGIFVVTSCGGSADQAAPVTDEPSVEIPADRSLEISYLDGSVIVSFEDVGFAHRSMSADLYRQSDTGWQRFGYLVTETADYPSGRLVLATQEPPVLLDGVLVDEQPDIYVAPNLPDGKYAVCASLIEDQEVLCGELTVAI
ncbi:MAG: hypothetical protein ACI9AO_001376 [Ilumatobacter sp.]|jgi:hypothetical protein